MKFIRTHGMTDTPAYYSWLNMKSRCDVPSATQYKDYGGRGIKYVAKWRKFEEFYKDMGERPRDTTLDRIDNDGDYEPSNCRWATYLEQSRNRHKYMNNTSGTVGVDWHKPTSKWRARIGIPGKEIYLGVFSHMSEAIQAREEAEIKLWRTADGN